MFCSIVAGFGTMCGKLFLNLLLNLARKARHQQGNSGLFWQEIFAFDFAARKKNTLSRPAPPPLWESEHLGRVNILGERARREMSLCQVSFFPRHKLCFTDEGCENGRGVRNCLSKLKKNMQKKAQEIPKRI